MTRAEEIAAQVEAGRQLARDQLAEKMRTKGAS